MTTEAEWIVPTVDVESPRPRHSLASLFALWWLVRAMAAAAILFTGLCVFSATLPLSSVWRLAIALAVVFALPLLLRRWIRRRATKKPALGWWFLAGVNLVFCALLCQSFPAAVGKALHDDGSWWLGEVDGWFPRRYRRATKRLGKLLQGVRPEAKPVIQDKVVRQPPVPTKPEPEPSPQVAIASQRWRSPVDNLRACLPRRTRSCRNHNCVANLRCPASTEVAAAATGVVVAAGDDHVALEHAGGKFRTEYRHLSSLHRPVHVGATIKAGERLGTSDTLQFSLGVRRGERYRFVDPLPVLLLWERSSTISWR